jgi:hypothetical protein
MSTIQDIFKRMGTAYTKGSEPWNKQAEAIRTNRDSRISPLDADITAKGRALTGRNRKAEVSAAISKVVAERKRQTAGFSATQAALKARIKGARDEAAQAIATQIHTQNATHETAINSLSSFNPVNYVWRKPVARIRHAKAIRRLNSRKHRRNETARIASTHQSVLGTETADHQSKVKPLLAQEDVLKAYSSDYNRDSRRAFYRNAAGVVVGTWQAVREPFRRTSAGPSPTP